MHLRNFLIFTFLLAFFAAGTAFAVSTRVFILDDADSLSDGELEGTTVYSSGSVSVGASTSRIELADVAVAWSFARGRGDTVFVGTGNEGKIYKVSGKSASVFAETGQLLVSSLARGPRGLLFAGTVPEGRIYTVDGRGKVKELARPEGTEHVWALEWDGRKKRLIAATGPEGKLYSIDLKGRVEEVYDSEASHLLALAIDKDGTFYVGTSDEAQLLRVDPSGHAEVVYDFPGTEVTDIDLRKGRLAVISNTFPAGSKSPIKKLKKASSAKSAKLRPKNLGKGQVWSVGLDGEAEMIFSNKKTHFTRVQVDNDGVIYAASGKEGRIFRIAPDRAYATWLDVDERQVLGMDVVGPYPMFVTGDGAALYRIDSGKPKSATWTSSVLDANVHSRFGELTWRGTAGIQMQTRSGNTSEPDETWTEWSKTVTSPGPVRSPAARYLQLRASFTRSDARLLAVQVYYLPENRRAVVNQVGVKAKPIEPKKTLGLVSKPSASRGSSEYELTWKVSNEDSDPLRYFLRFREEKQNSWRDILREHEVLTQSKYTWETSSIPDGYYVVEVEASDELANPVERTLRHRQVSEPILIDNHAPQVSLKGRGPKVSGVAKDVAGPVSKIEVSIDGSPWRVVFPVDGLLDTPEERFSIDLERSPDGHIVAVRATDAAGNVGSAEITVR